MRRKRHSAYLVALVALAFYLATLAPTVLWGDDAYFQRIAPLGTSALRPDGGGHWLWMQAAHLFTRLPIGSVAYRVNLLSAVAASATLYIFYTALQHLGLTRTSSLVATLALAVSHTFWMHAVRAEVYTVFTLFMALHLLLWFWQDEPFWTLLASSALFGTTLLAHQMGILLFPAFAFLLWARRDQLARQQLGLTIAAFALGLLPFFIVLHAQIGSRLSIGMGETAVIYFTQSGDDFRSQMFDTSLNSIIRDSALWLGFLGYQFFGVAGLLGLLGVWRASRERSAAVWGTLLVLYATCVAFAFSYHVADQFVFYLPSYIAFAIFIAFGYELLESRNKVMQKSVLRTVIVCLVVALPIALYFGAATMLDNRPSNPLDVRTLPERQPYAYLLWPSKARYDGAERFARTSLESLPPNSALIAEHTPYNPLRYMQAVENVRPDVQLIQISPGGDVATALERVSAETAVFLADNNPSYYNLTRLENIDLIPHGYIYQLVMHREDE